MGQVIWAIALLFTVGMFASVWIKIGRDEYYPTGYIVSALWFIPIVYGCIPVTWFTP